jgi:hypothetical protein
MLTFILEVTLFRLHVDELTCRIAGYGHVPRFEGPLLEQHLPAHLGKHVHQPPEPLEDGHEQSSAYAHRPVQTISGQLIRTVLKRCAD